MHEACIALSAACAALGGVVGVLLVWEIAIPRDSRDKDRDRGNDRRLGAIETDLAAIKADVRRLDRRQQTANGRLAEALEMLRKLGGGLSPEDKQKLEAASAQADQALQALEAAVEENQPPSVHE